MFEKLLALILGAKSGALSGVLILAGTVATVTTGNGVTTITLQDPTPTPAVETSASPKPSPLESPAPSKPPKAGDEHKTAPSTSPVPVSCADEVHARNEARQKVQAAFTKYHVALEQLRGEHASAGATDTIKKADSMLKEIREKTDRILSEMGACPDPKHEDEDRDEDDDDDNDHDDKDKGHKGKNEHSAQAHLTVVVASRVEADALTMQQVADRAIAAMETVFNLAKSAATATPSPTPKPTPRVTERPKRTERPNVTSTRKPETRHGAEATKRPERD